MMQIIQHMLTVQVKEDDWIFNKSKAETPPVWDNSTAAAKKMATLIELELVHLYKY